MRSPTRLYVFLAASLFTVVACSDAEDEQGSAGPTPEATNEGPPGPPEGEPPSENPAPTDAPYAGGEATVSVLSDAPAITGKTTIRVVPSNPAAVSKIDVLVDAQTVGTLTGSVTDLPWDSLKVGNGAHAIAARLYDLTGKTWTAPDLAVTTKNFMLAGKWKYTKVSYAGGVATNGCSDTTFTVGFAPDTSTVTFPTFSVKCTAQNGAPYTTSVKGFTTVLTDAMLEKPLNQTVGSATINFSSTRLTRTDGGYILKGDVVRTL